VFTPDGEGSGGWPSHDIAITNIVWCMAYKKGGRWGGRLVRNGRAKVCKRVGIASGGGGVKRMMAKAKGT